jgi:hypothetical protein
MKLGPGRPVLQSALSEVLFTGLSAKQRKASFYLVFTDAQTGEFIQGTAGG